MKVQLRVTLLCIVSNNSYTNVGNIWNITKYTVIYFCINLIINILKNIRYNLFMYLLQNSREEYSICLLSQFCVFCLLGVTAQRLSSQWYNISVICAINNKVNILYRVNRHLQGLTPRLFTSCLYSTFQSLECWFLMLFIIIHTVVTDFSYKLIQFYFDFTSRKQIFPNSYIQLFICPLEFHKKQKTLNINELFLLYTDYSIFIIP